MVSALLTVLMLSVLQLALALHVRNTVLDAAAEGARIAALTGNGLADGRERTAQLIEAAIGKDYSGDIEARYGTRLGFPSTIVTVRTTLPLIGLLGVGGGLEVSGHAALEQP